MKIFSVVKAKRECYGHGDYANVKYIPRTGAYDSGPFHPFFIFKEEAIKYLKANDLYGCEVEAVTLCMGGCEISAPNPEGSPGACAPVHPLVGRVLS